MSVREVMIPVACCWTWGPEQMPEELTGRITNQEYQTLRGIMQGYHNKGLCTAAGITFLLLIIITIIVVVNEMRSSIGGLYGLIGVPWSLCPAVAMSMAKAKVNADILNPKGMKLQCGRCFWGHKIVLGCSTSDNVEKGGVGAPEAQSVTEAASLAKKSQSDVVDGKRERECTPAKYGVVELTHSAKSDVGEDVVRSMYAHITDGAKRSERIIASTSKVVYVPEGDLSDLAQVYMSKQMCELRVKMKNEDGARRVLRFFRNNGSSLAVGSD